MTGVGPWLRSQELFEPGRGLSPTPEALSVGSPAASNPGAEVRSTLALQYQSLRRLVRISGVRTSAKESGSAVLISVGVSGHGTSTCNVSRAAHFVSDGGGGASESSVGTLSGVKARGRVDRASSDGRSVTRSASAILGVGETVAEPSRA